MYLLKLYQIVKTLWFYEFLASTLSINDEMLFQIMIKEKNLISNLNDRKFKTKLYWKTIGSSLASK